MKPKSYIRLYWTVWLGFVTCFIIAAFTISFWVRDEETLFSLFACYIIPTCLAITVLFFVEDHRLMNYLKKHHREKWEELTSSAWFIGYPVFPFVYSSDDLGDPVVEELKLNYRRFLRLAATFFLSGFPLTCFIVMLHWAWMLFSDN
jgi:uncharacterized membrane protein YbhN (UPF0104 family)